MVDFTEFPIPSKEIPELENATASIVDGANDLAIIRDVSANADKRILIDDFLKFSNGTKSQPSISFRGDLDTGIYRKAANSIAISVGGDDGLVITPARRVGINTESPAAKLHIVNQNVTCGIRSSSYWSGTTASPYQNNDTSLFETFNNVVSNSTNYSWSVSAPNGYNNIPAGVTDLGYRIGVYGWAVSVFVPGKYEHHGTLEMQVGVRGRVGFQGPGSTGTVNSAVAVRGEIINDSTGSTIKEATAIAAAANDNLGTVEKAYGVRSSAIAGSLENWSFLGDAGKLFNQDQALFGSFYSEMASKICARSTGNAIEFGFPTAGGYGCAAGSLPSSGDPFVSFCSKADPSGDTFATSGKMGHVIRNNIGAGALIFYKLLNVNAAGQAGVESYRIDNNNRVHFQETPIIKAFAPASATAPGQTGQISFDSSYFYVCIGTNSWRRAALSSW